MKTIKFKSFSSGSCGNCYLLGIFDGNICECSVLIDAGVSPRRLKKELAHNGLSPACVSAMLVTHDHMDHIRSLGSYCKQLSYPVWATDTLASALSRHFVVGEYFNGVKRILKKDEWNEIVEDRIKARYFVVPHDATQTVGYAIQLDDYKFLIMTDLGRVTDEAINFAKQADTVVIESNYDYDMLRHGPYPKILQDRICGGSGHLSNDECAQALSQLAHEGLKNVFLCHLSEHNNTPGKAHEANCQVLDPSVRLVTLPRQLASQLFTL